MRASGALTLGPACQLPSGCTVEGDPGCTALCVVQPNTLRARVAGAALAFLRSPDNRTGLTRDDALPWATHLQQNTSALFGDRDLAFRFAFMNKCDETEWPTLSVAISKIFPYELRAIADECTRIADLLDSDVITSTKAA